MATETTIADTSGITARVYSGFQPSTALTMKEGGCLFQFVVAPEQLSAHRDCRNSDNPQLERLLGSCAKRVLHGPRLDALGDGARVQLRRRGRDQHVVELRQGAPGREELPERRK